MFALNSGNSTNSTTLSVRLCQSLHREKYAVSELKLLVRYVLFVVEFFQFPESVSNLHRWGAYYELFQMPFYFHVSLFLSLSRSTANAFVEVAVSV